jgi:hypothetical protein
MPDSLIAEIHEAGVSCRALAAWCACSGGREDRCETCVLGGPETCDREVIEALVSRLVRATEQTDAALRMTRYWQGLAGRLCDMIMR